MPLYDYRCRSCGHLVEVMHAIGGTGPERCEVCGGEMAKLLSAPAIHFKGTGWAKKDARAASTASNAKREGATASTETKSTETKSTETKSTEAPARNDASPAEATTTPRKEATTSRAASTGPASD
jgi:putative FmdB family regulatory protein